MPGRLLPFLGHDWQRELWDKFGTGIRNVAFYRCRNCHAMRHR